MRSSANIATIAAVVAAVFLFQTSAAARCLYEDAEFVKYLDDNKPRRQEVDYRGFKEQAIATMRFTLSFADLDDSSKYCTRVGESRSNYQGSTITCTQDDILTDAKKDILRNKILPAAVTKLESVLSVDSVTGALKVPQGSCAGGFTIPSSHSSTGVTGTDFILYVAAGQTPNNVLAWAATCTFDGNGRPVTGRANFGPAYIEWSDTDTSVNNAQVATAVHEILHALGFNSNGFASKGSETRRGKTVTTFNHPTVLAKYREFVGCTTAGAPEIEDEGSAGSAGSHWDRRLMKDEIMAAAGGEILSAMTLSALEASGHYTVNYNNAETMGWGANAGCSFITDKCNTATGGLGKFFCNDESGQTACTWDNKAIGVCSVSSYTSALPSHFQYFSDPTKGGQQFLDHCPIVQEYSNRICTSEKTASNTESIYGYSFGAASRCFDTVGPLTDERYVQQGSTHRCLQTRCFLNKIQFKVGNSAFIDCPVGTSVSVPSSTGFKGSVKCPASYEAFCTAEITGATLATPAPPAGTPAPPGATPAPPGSTPQPPSTPAPTPAATNYAVSDGTPKFKGTSFLSGDAFQGLFSSDTILLRNAIREDIANFYGFDATQVQMNQMSPSNGKLFIEFVFIGIDDDAARLGNQLQTQVPNGAFLVNTKALHSEKSSGAVLLESTSISPISETTSFCGSNYDADQCNMIVTAIVGFGFIVMLFAILICVCCKEGREYKPLPDGGKEPYV